MNFDEFFQTATGNTPYLYQCRLACGEPPANANCDLANPDEATRQWLSGSDPKGPRSRLINSPTGLGKTAAVVLAWLSSAKERQLRCAFARPVSASAGNRRDDEATGDLRLQIYGFRFERPCSLLERTWLNMNSMAKTVPPTALASSNAWPETCAIME